MHRSTERIITTHVGSLARPTELLEMMRDKEAGKPYDHAAFDRQVRDAVADRVHRQVECGIDVVTDGEMGKVSFLTYVKDRLGGFVRGRRRHDPAGVVAQGDRRLSRLLQRVPQEVHGCRRPAQATRVHGTGDLRRPGPAEDRHRQPERARSPTTRPLEAFMPSSGPSGFGRNEHYASHGEYLAAVGEAMRVEYLAIVDAGFVLQIDDPWLMEILSDPTTDDDTKQQRRAGAHRRPQPLAARHPARVDPPPHLLRAQPWPAPHRHPARRRRSRG